MYREHFTHTYGVAVVVVSVVVLVGPYNRMVMTKDHVSGMWIFIIIIPGSVTPWPALLRESTPLGTMGPRARAWE